MGGSCSTDLGTSSTAHRVALADDEGYESDTRIDDVLRRTGDTSARALETWNEFGASSHILNDSSIPVPTHNPIRGRRSTATKAPGDAGTLPSQHDEGGGSHSRITLTKRSQQLPHQTAPVAGTSLPLPPHAVMVPSTASISSMFPSPLQQCQTEAGDDTDSDHDYDSSRPSSSSTHPCTPSPSRGLGPGVTSSSSSKGGAEEYDPHSWISDMNGKLHGTLIPLDDDTVSMDDGFYMMPPPSLGQVARTGRRRSGQRLPRSNSSSSVIPLGFRSAAMDANAVDCPPDSTAPVAVALSAGLGRSLPIPLASNNNNGNSQSLSSTFSAASESAFLNSAQWDSLSRAERMASTRAMVLKLKEVKQENELLSKGWRRGGGHRSLNGSTHSSEGSISVTVSFKEKDDDDDDDDE